MLPEALSRSIAQHYNGQPLSDEVAHRLLQLRSQHPDLLEVPSTYRYAYRLMAHLPVEYLHAHGIPNPNVMGFVKGGTYHSKFPHVGCWTIDKEVFAEDTDSIVDHLALKPEPGKASGLYGAVLACSLRSQRNKFLFNPDTLPKAVRATRFSYQREVVSVADVNLVGLAYFAMEEDSEEIRDTLLGALEYLP